MKQHNKLYSASSTHCHNMPSDVACDVQNPKNVAIQRQKMYNNIQIYRRFMPFLIEAINSIAKPLGNFMLEIFIKMT